MILRRWSIDLNGNPFILETDGPTFRCVFDVDINFGATTSYADIRLYNLRKDTANKMLKRGTPITLRAGYDNTIDIIFKGTIANTFKEREGASVVTRILCYGGDTAETRGVVNVSLGANCTFTDIMDTLAQAIPAPLVMDVKQFSDVQPFPRGYPLNGDVSKYLDTLGNAYNFDWVIDRGRLVVSRRGAKRESVITEISRETGMELIPEITGGPDGVGCNVSVRLNPKLQIQGRFRIKSDFASFNTGNMYLTDVPKVEGLGVYNILNLHHVGDTHGNAWSSRLTGVKEVQPAPVNTVNAEGAVVWGKTVNDESFRVRVREIGANLNIDPTWLMAIMAFETRKTFDPQLRNSLSGAIGLIQFMPPTAKRLGTSTLALSRMTAVQQLDYVEKYFKYYATSIHSFGDCYMAVLWPKAIGKPDSFILWTRGSIEYAQNPGLDLNGDGTITKLEAYTPANRMLVQGAQHAM